MPNCPDGQVWKDTCQCCVDPDVSGRLETLYALATRVSFVSIDRVFDDNTPGFRLQRVENSISILETALATLSEGRYAEAA